MGEHVYATQFHPELDVEGLCPRIEVYRHHGYFDPERGRGAQGDGPASRVESPSRSTGGFVERYASGLTRYRHLSTGGTLRRMTEHVDVLIVGAGLSGHRRRLPADARAPRRSLRDPRGPRRQRRHLGPLPLPRHPLGLRHVHPRLPVPALARATGARRRPVDPRLPPRRPPGSTASTGRSATGHRVVAAAWDSDDARWTVDRRARRRARSRSPASFLWSCSGYYDYDAGLHPGLPGRRATSAATVVHPQHWPEDLDYAGKRVVVIGSGATAVTLVARRWPGGGRARHDAAALADVHPVRPRRATRSRPRLRRLLPAKLRLPRRPLEERSWSRAGSTSSAAVGPGWCAA